MSPEHLPVADAIARLLGPVDTIEPLASGAGGRSFLVSQQGRRYVAKRFDSRADLLLGPVEQYQLLQSLAGTALAPVPRACDGAAGLLVVEFLADARAPTSAELGQPATLASVTGLLWRLHAVAARPPEFSPAVYARSYLARIGGEAQLSERDRERYRELQALAGRPLPGPACLCHNDLTAENLLLGARPRLIDFDFAVTATPVLDLASLVVMNRLDRPAAGVLLETYYRGEVPFPAEEFARVQRLVRLLAHFWAMAAEPADDSNLMQYRIEHD